MTLDTQKYLELVEGVDLIEAQKVELVETVWAVVESFVDQAFGVHPVQLCRAEAEDYGLQQFENEIELRNLPIELEFNLVWRSRKRGNS